MGERQAERDALTAAGGKAEGKAGGTVGGTARLDFGDPLERRSSDDIDQGWGERPAAGSERGLDWYLNQRPPHHGG